MKSCALNKKSGPARLKVAAFAPIAIAALIAGAVAAPPAHADVIYNFGTGSNGNTNQSGTATFDFSATSLTLTLNNTSTMNDIASILDGFNFSLSGATSLALTGISSTDGLVNCTSGTCVDTPTTFSTPSSYWYTQFSGTSVNMNAGSTSGSYHPYGISNDTLDTWVTDNGSQGGLTNSQHNPMIEGPVTFTFSFSGTGPSVSNVQFLFGTTPDVIDGSVPEPGTLALLAAGLAALGFALRRRHAISRG